MTPATKSDTLSLSDKSAPETENFKNVACSISNKRVGTHPSVEPEISAEILKLVKILPNLLPSSSMKIWLNSTI